MKPFTEIWKDIEWILEDMQAHGACLFEGYILGAKEELLLPGVEKFALEKACIYEGCGTSTWSEGSTKEEWEQVYSLPEYLKFFQEHKLYNLHFNYKYVFDEVVLNMRIIFWNYDEPTIEIICYREPILESINPQVSMEKATDHMKYIFSLFQGESLFIGPDTSEYPTSNEKYPSVWVKVI